MKILTNISVLIALMAFTPVHSQTIKDLWIEMPDSLIGYLDKNIRTKLMDFAIEEKESKLLNKLNDTTAIDVITDKYISVGLSEASRMEMRLLQRQDGTNLICMVRTYYGPMAESAVTFFDKNWNRISDIQLPDMSSLGLIVKPEGMSDSDFNDIISLMDIRLIEVKLSTTDDSMVINYFLPNSSKEETDKIKSILAQRILKWNGITFN